MESIIFVGIQATGKSSFFRERFSDTHVRVNLDMLKTRTRESILIRACVEAKQPFVVDNTNPTVAERGPYIAIARAAGFRVIGYYFASKVCDALLRNSARSLERQVPRVGVLGTFKKLQLPSLSEGFDQLFYVELSEPAGFTIKEWQP